MNHPKSNRLVAVPAPVFYVLAFGSGLIVDHFVRWRPNWIERLHVFGWALIAAGLVLGPGSAVLFALKRTTLNPGGQPSRLVTSGAFKISRNPMYLGLAVIYLGAAIAFNRPWAIVLLPLPVLLLNLVVIPFEESSLEHTFGVEFKAYRQRIRRWL
jgi:protein-S-isoprenylcysteine O-methyltransferase Ste14